MNVLIHKNAQNTSVLAEPLYSIEKATPEENAKGQKIMAEYQKDPSSFVPWERRSAAGKH